MIPVKSRVIIPCLRSLPWSWKDDRSMTGEKPHKLEFLLDYLPRLRAVVADRRKK